MTRAALLGYSLCFVLVAAALYGVAWLFGLHPDASGTIGQIALAIIRVFIGAVIVIVIFAWARGDFSK